MLSRREKRKDTFGYLQVTLLSFGIGQKLKLEGEVVSSECPWTMV